MRDLVDAEAIRSFLAVAEELNFRRAAERLHVDQSALSRRIRKLEAGIGFELFVRSTREVRLTEAGRVFYEDNLAILSQFRHSVARARRVSGGGGEPLRIGYMSFAALDVMPQALQTFRSAHPGASVQLRYLKTQGQKLALAQGEIDAGFMIGPFIHEDFATVAVAAERLMALLPEGHFLARRERVALADLAACDMILGEASEWDFYRSVVDDVFAARGFAIRPALEVSDALGIVGLVATGFGVSVYPESLRRMRPAGCVIRPLLDCDRRIETIVAWRRERRDPSLASFIECCRERLKAIQPVPAA